jgi:hypothetical protein
MGTFVIKNVIVCILLPLTSGGEAKLNQRKSVFFKIKKQSSHLHLKEIKLR